MKIALVLHRSDKALPKIEPYTTFRHGTCWIGRPPRVPDGPTHIYLSLFDSKSLDVSLRTNVLYDVYAYKCTCCCLLQHIKDSLEKILYLINCVENKERELVGQVEL